MSKLPALLSVILCFSITTQAQTISISGSVEDTINKKGVHNAVVALLSTRDSVLYKFTRTNETGKYSFVNIKPGPYLVMTTHPYFGDVIYTTVLNISDTKMPGIALTSKSNYWKKLL